MIEGKGVAYYQVICRYRNSDESDEMKVFTDSCNLMPPSDDKTAGKDSSNYVIYIVLMGAICFFIYKKRRKKK
jgi:hypothetical protein